MLKTIRNAIVGMMKRLRIERSLHPRAAARVRGSSVVIVMLVKTLPPEAFQRTQGKPFGFLQSRVTNRGRPYGFPQSHVTNRGKPYGFPQGPSGQFLVIALVLGESRLPLLCRLVEGLLRSPLTTDHEGVDVLVELV